MFRNAYQSGLLTILYSCGASPLEHWGMQVKNGCIRRVTDEEVETLALEIAGANISTAFIYTPKNPKHVLGIRLPFFVMVMKNMKRYLTFEITILDDQHMHRRFRMSNFQSVTKVGTFCTFIPIGLGDGWSQIQFNLSDVTRKAYGSNYLETTRVQIHANCRLRRIYFTDQLYADDQLPEEYRLFSRIRRVQDVSKNKREKKKSVASSQARISVKAVPADEPPAFHVDSTEQQQEERRTTPIPSTEPSPLIVAPDGASKVRIEINQEPEDVEADEHETEQESEADSEEGEEAPEQEYETEADSQDVAEAAEQENEMEAVSEKSVEGTEQDNTIEEQQIPELSPSNEEDVANTEAPENNEENLE